jgi:PAS domain S-box-containing protein
VRWYSGPLAMPAGYDRTAATLSHKHKRHAAPTQRQQTATPPDLWPMLEEYNRLDAQARADWLAAHGLPTSDPELLRIVTKCHFVIPGTTRHRCVQCGECCRYARKTATFTYEPCPFLDEHNQCAKHANRYHVCKWFPFWLFDGGRLGPLLTIKPYCAGYGQGDLVDYAGTIKRISDLDQQQHDDADGAFVIHELVYLPELREWAFPTRANVDSLLKLMSKAAVESSAEKQAQSAEERIGQLHYAHHYTSGLLGALSEPQATVTEQGSITDVNHAFCDLVGRSRADIIRSNLADLFANPQALSADLGQCFSHGKVTAVPRKLRPEHGEAVPIVFNAMVFRDRSDGLVHEAIVCVNKVSPALFGELAHSKTYARGLLEASLDALLVIDLAGAISDVNQALVELSGRPRDQLLRAGFQDFFLDPKRAAEGLAQTLATGQVRNYELDWVAADGSPIPVSFNATVYRDANDVVQGVFAAARDIRESRRLIRELEQAHAYARGLIESGLDLMVTISRDGVVMDVNQAAEKLTGVARERLIGTRFESYFTDTERARAGVATTFASGQVRDYRLDLVTRAGVHVPVSFNATPYRGPDGTIHGVFAVARDLSGG